jgi:hypothetical protein
MSGLKRCPHGYVIAVSLAIWPALASASSLAVAQTDLTGRIPACKVSQLAAAEDRKVPDQIPGGLGHNALTITVQNHFSSPCILRGIPKLELLYSTNHRKFPAQFCADCSDYLFRSQPITDVFLESGRFAYLVLGFDTNDSNGPCTEADPKYDTTRFQYSDIFLNLYLPDQRQTPLKISPGPWRSCGAIDVTPFLKELPVDGSLPAQARLATNPEWTIFAPANDVSFTISTAKSSYRINDSISLNYRIVNIGNRPLHVPRTWQPTCLTALHVSAWFESNAGQYSVLGYGSSCAFGPTDRPPTLAERMNKEAVLLKPGDYFDGSLPLDPSMYQLTPGPYLIEATLYGWDPDKFSYAQQTELDNSRGPFLRGEVPATLQITLPP